MRVDRQRLGFWKGSVLSNLAAADQIPHYRYDKAQLIIAGGKRGFGKTWLIQRYIQRREPRLWMVDIHDDFPEVPAYADLDESFRVMQERDPDTGELEPCWARFCPDFARMSTEQRHELGEVMFGKVSKYLRQSLVVYNESTLWSGALSGDTLKDQIRQARRLGLKHLIDTQRFGEAPDIMRSEGTHLAIFCTTRYRDREVLARETEPEIAEIARTLGVGRCLLVNL